MSLKCHTTYVQTRLVFEIQVTVTGRKAIKWSTKLTVKSTSRNMVLDIHNYCEISREFLYSSLTAAPIMAPLLAGSVKSRGKNALVSE